METPKKKPLTGLFEAVKQLRKRPPNPAIIERYNELIRKDEEAEKAEKNKRDSERRKIARDPEIGA
jgi:hypothetical protein